VALHQAVLFSSMASLSPAVSQSSYGASNAALNGWAEDRQTLGVPATSVLWGVWAAGMGTDAPEYVALLERVGMGAIMPDVGLTTLDKVMQAAVVGRAPPQVAVAPAAWGRLLSTGRHAASPMFAEIVATTEVAGGPLGMLQRASVVEGSSSNGSQTVSEKPGIPLDDLLAIVSGAASRVLGVGIEGTC
jgi:KR domain